MRKREKKVNKSTKQKEKERKKLSNHSWKKEIKQQRSKKKN